MLSFNVRPCCLHQLVAEGHIIQKSFDRSNELSRRIRNQKVLSSLYGKSRTANPCGHRGYAESHRLQNFVLNPCLDANGAKSYPGTPEIRFHIGYRRYYADIVFTV